MPSIETVFVDFVKSIIDEHDRQNASKKMDAYSNKIKTRHASYDDAKELAQVLADGMLRVYGVYRGEEYNPKIKKYVEFWGVRMLQSKKYRCGAELQCEAVLPSVMCPAVEEEMAPVYMNQWFDLGPSRF